MHHHLPHLLILLSSICCIINATSIECNKYKLKNGRVRMKPNSRLARFYCNKGYNLLGTKYSGCLKGYFDVDPPICVNSKPKCKEIRDLNNGLVFLEPNKITAHFFCKPEYRLIGSNVSICDDTKWLYQLPHCLGSNLTEPELSCTFENDMCGWSHDLNHDFDWERTNKAIYPGETGPQWDHTKKNGYFMYIKGRSRAQNETSRLISPIFGKSTKICVSFYYHMYGKDMGTLNVYIKGDTDTLEKLHPDFSLSGNQGNLWLLGQVSVENRTNTNFQVIFEGIRGKSYLSDIAIDDININYDVCQEDATSTSDDTRTSETSELPYFEFCFNNCGRNITIFQITCSCNENCFEYNNCCPDFIQYCFLASSVDYEDVDAASTVDLTSESSEIQTTTDQTTETTEQITPSTLIIIIKSTLKSSTISSPQDDFLEMITDAASSPQIETDLLPKTDPPNVQYLQQNTKITQKIPNNYLFVYVGIGSCFAVVSIFIVGLIVVKRNNLTCIKFQNSRNNDSMSDVRFLATDEVLDFTWQRSESI